MELPIDITQLGIVAIVCTVFIIGIRNLPQFRENSTKLLKQRLKERDEYIEELKSTQTKYKNQYFNLLNKVEQEPEIEIPNGDLSSPDFLKSILPSILPSITSFLPKWAQGIANNPQIAGLVVDWFQKNPEMAMKILGKFMKSGQKPSAQTEPAIVQKNFEVY